MNQANLKIPLGGTSKTIDFNQPLKNLLLPRPQFVLSETSILETALLMKSFKIGSILVVDDKVQLLGIATERDFLMKVIGDNMDLGRPIDEVMTPRPKTLTLEDTLESAIKDMHLGRYRHVPIINEYNSPVSIISIKDVMSFIYDSLWPN